MTKSLLWGVLRLGHNSNGNCIQCYSKSFRSQSISCSLCGVWGVCRKKIHVKATLLRPLCIDSIVAVWILVNLFRSCQKQLILSWNDTGTNALVPLRSRNCSLVKRIKNSTNSIDRALYPFYVCRCRLHPLRKKNQLDMNFIENIQITCALFDFIILVMAWVSWAKMTYWANMLYWDSWAIFTGIDCINSCTKK